ncbi:hypothetical protein NQ317_010638 [Molorchus minor]|uniref:Uncharacterized protein n=1 Tax=Molorchus minor TaxID=1323400 RepID=A0ABQ9IUP6_9CUCU|nr:hypothetical protein NQ317_010638 [Molorchus minor]
MQGVLHVRGFEEVRGETAASMRRKLGIVLANDAFGQLIVSETFQPVVLEEIKVVLNKIESLEGTVAAKPIVEGSDIVILVGTKLKHLTGRLQRLKIQDTEENKPTLRARMETAATTLPPGHVVKQACPGRLVLESLARLC